MHIFPKVLFRIEADVSMQAKYLIKFSNIMQTYNSSKKYDADCLNILYKFVFIFT